MGPISWIVLVFISTTQSEPNIQPQSYMHLIYPSGMSAVYEFYARSGYPAGTIGSELMAVVLPPKKSPGRSRLVPWYSLERFSWYNESIDKTTEDMDNYIVRCRSAKLSYLNCAFRWKHWSFHKDKIEKISSIRSDVLKKAHERSVLQVSEYRMDYVGFYCLLRRALRMRPLTETTDKNRRDSVYETVIHPDLRGVCPRVCSRRATALDDEVNVPSIDPKTHKASEVRSRIMRPEKRIEQCLSIPGLSTVLSGRCHSNPLVGLDLAANFKCACPPSQFHGWQIGTKSCAHFATWRFPGYWWQTAEEGTIPYRFDPPEYFEYLKCDRRGTLEMTYFGLKEDTAENGFVKPYLRRAEYCRCKPNFYGTRCEKRRNPCEASSGKAVSGNTACRVTDGNKCYPNLILATYTCACITGYGRFNFRRGPMVDLDNCMQQFNGCEHLGCVNGQCVSSTVDVPYGQGKRVVTARCVCHRGWTGRLCSRPLPLDNWFPWTSWSICSPSCTGDDNKATSQQRFRRRTRWCMNPRSDCEPATRLGSHTLLEDARTAEQRRICRPRPCDRYLRLRTPAKTSEFSRNASEPMMNLLWQSMSMMDWLVFGLITFIPGASVIAYWSVHMQNHRAGHEGS